MARTFNGSSDYASVATALAAGTPFTLAAWIKPAAVTAGMAIAGGNDTSDASRDENALYVAGDVANDPLRAYTVTGGSGFNISNVNGVVAGSWQHAAGVWSAINSRQAFLDGTSGTADTTSDDPSAAIDTFVIGALRQSAATIAYFNGDIAEVALWDVALTQAEITALSLGVSPLLVRPDALTNYWPLVENGIDIVGGQTLTFTGTTDSADHPPITYPAPGGDHSLFAGISGTLAKTLGTLTSTATGTVVGGGTLSGDDLALTYCISGVARSGATRSNYFPPVPKITFNGVDRTSRVLKRTLEVTQELDKPTTCSFVVKGTKPSFYEAVQALIPSEFFTAYMSWFRINPDFVELADADPDAECLTGSLLDGGSGDSLSRIVVGGEYLFGTIPPVADGGNAARIEIYQANGSNVSYSVDATTSFTLACWMKIDRSMGASEEQQVVRTSTAYNGVTRYGLHLFEGKPRFRVYDGTTTVTVTSATGIDGGDGSWHFVVGVRNVGTDTCKLYVDGVEVGSTTDTTTGAISTAAHSYFVGYSYPATGDADIQVGDVIFRKGAAWTAAEILNLYTCATSDFAPNLFDEVNITVGAGDDAHLFSGWVVNVRSLTKRKEQRSQRYEVQCIDHSIILDHRVVWGKKFTDEQASSIVSTLMAEYFDEVLDWDFVESDLPRLDFQANHGERFSAVLNRLAKQLRTATGETAYWRLDEDKNLHFFMTAEPTKATITYDHDSVSLWDLEIERDASQFRNHVYAIGRSSTCPNGAAVGATTLAVEDTSGFTQFPEGTHPFADYMTGTTTAGRARVGANYITFTGRSTTSGNGNLTGIPASGEYSIQHAIEEGATISVIVEHGNPAAVALAKRMYVGSEDDLHGRVQHTVSDLQAGTEALAQLAEASATRFAHLLGERRVQWKTRDVTMEPGQPVSFTLTRPVILLGDFVVQRVLITIDPDEDQFPVRQVLASRDTRELEDILASLTEPEPEA